MNLLMVVIKKRKFYGSLMKMNTLKKDKEIFFRYMALLKIKSV